MASVGFDPSGPNFVVTTSSRPFIGALGGYASCLRGPESSVRLLGQCLRGSVCKFSDHRMFPKKD
jgi:hypothetical protein